MVVTSACRCYGGHFGLEALCLSLGPVGVMVTTSAGRRYGGHFGLEALWWSLRPTGVMVTNLACRRYGDHFGLKRYSGQLGLKVFISLSKPKYS